MNIGSLIGWIVGLVISMCLSVIIAKEFRIEGSGLYSLSMFIAVISGLVCGVFGTLIY